MPEGWEWEPMVPPRIDANNPEEVGQYLMERAQKAHKLLSDPDFNDWYKEELEANNLVMIQSKPGQVELREDCYFRIRGLQDLVNRMAGALKEHEQFVAQTNRGPVEP